MHSAIRFSRSSSTSGPSTASAALREVSSIPDQHNGAPHSASSATASRASRVSASRTSAVHVTDPNTQADDEPSGPHDVHTAREARHAAYPIPSSYPGSAMPRDAPARSRSRSMSRSTRGLSHDDTGGSSGGGGGGGGGRRNTAQVPADGPIPMNLPWIPPPPIYGVPLPDGANQNPYYAHYYDPVAMSGHAYGRRGAPWPFCYPDVAPPPPPPQAVQQSAVPRVNRQATATGGHTLQWPAWSEWPTPDALPLPSAFPLPPRALPQQPHTHDQQTSQLQPPVWGPTTTSAASCSFPLPTPPMPWWAWWPPMPPQLSQRSTSSSSSSSASSSSASEESGSSSSSSSSTSRTPPAAPRRPAAHGAGARRTPPSPSTRANPPRRRAAGLPMGSVVTPIAAAGGGGSGCVAAMARRPTTHHAELPPHQQQRQQRRDTRVDVYASETDRSSPPHSQLVVASSSSSGSAPCAKAVERRVYASSSGSSSQAHPGAYRRPADAAAPTKAGEGTAAEGEVFGEDTGPVQHTMDAAATAYLGKMEELYQRLRHRYEEVMMSPDKAVTEMESDLPSRRIGRPHQSQQTPSASFQDERAPVQERRLAPALRAENRRSPHPAPAVGKSPAAAPTPPPPPAPSLSPLTSSSSAASGSTASSLRQELQQLESHWLRLEEMRQHPSGSRGSTTATSTTATRTFSVAPTNGGAEAVGRSDGSIPHASLLQLIHDRKRLLTTAA